MPKQKIHLLGNEHIEGDSEILKLKEMIKSNTSDYKLIHTKDPLTLIGEKRIIAIDTAKGIDEITIIKDTDRLAEPKTTTCHDLDASKIFTIMKTANPDIDITIIAIPERTKITRETSNKVQKIIEQELKIQ